ncbi:MAG: Tautomerase enzyme [Solirubrobacterales bacterium]|jgi:phenylpyruvate tautomerase PptA (4-oxalocrotonate tautomerase family)|nr:Tautomerase enzyme [Solirubrobacterales bacterium]
MSAGRSDAEVGALVKALTEAVEAALGIDRERITVHVHELPPDRIARGGVPLSER